MKTTCFPAFRLKCVSVIAGLCLAVSASATVIDFNSAPLGAFGSMQTQGFNFSWIGFGDTQSVRDLGSGNYALTDSGPSNVSGAQVFMSRVGGGTFSVTQFDILNLNGGSPGFRVDFGGVTYTSAGTIVRGDLIDITSLSINIVSGAPFGTDYGVDNIHVTASGVPDSASTLILSLAGFIGLIGMRRKQAA